MLKEIDKQIKEIEKKLNEIEKQIHEEMKLLMYKDVDAFYRLQELGDEYHKEFKKREELEKQKKENRKAR